MNHENRWKFRHVHLFDSFPALLAAWTRPAIDNFTIKEKIEAVIQFTFITSLRQFQAQMREALICGTFKSAAAFNCATKLPEK